MGDVRLVESGTVQYCYSASADTGEWIGVCSMGDSATLSQIVCRQVLNNTNEDDGMSLLYAGGDTYSDHILQIFTLSTSLLNSRLQTYSCSAVGHSSLLVRVPSIPAHHVLALTLHAEVGWSSLPFTLYMSPLAGACNSGRCDCAEGWSGLNCRDRQYTCMHTSPLIHMYVSSHVQPLAIKCVLMEGLVLVLGSVAVPLDGEGRTAQNVSQHVHNMHVRTCTCT